MDLKLQKGVYSIPFACGFNYIGEIGWSIQVRIKEPKSTITHKKLSDLVENSIKTKHHICVEDAKILTKEDSL